MPQAAAVVASFFYTAATALGVSAGAAASFAVAATNALAYATNALLLSKALGALQKRGNTGESRGMEVSLTDSTASARIIYGEVKTGGINMIPPYTSGANGEHLHQVLALAMHEIDSFQTFYFDQTTMPAPAAVSGAAGDGLISSGAYSGAAWIRGYVGNMTQTVDFILNAAFPSQWPSTSRGRGVAYVALKYDYGKGKIYKGVPQTTIKIRGAKVYDPRLDSTNGGAGSHRYATPSTWAYSVNPALCWANYRIAAYGFGLDPATEINWTDVAAAANICDALVANKDGGTQKRYTCNGILTNSPGSLGDNNRKLIDSMFGRETYVNGKWSCFAGGWTAASYTVEKIDWLSIDSIQAVSGADGGRFNEVHCFYPDPARNWQRVECVPRRNATYKSDDYGKTIGLEMEQPMCIDESEAQRKAEFLLRSSRNGVKLIGVLPPRFHKIKTFDVIALNFAELGWASKTFRVSAMTLLVDGSVRVALTEEQSTDWTDLSTGEYSAPSTATIPATNPTTPSAPQSLTITPLAGSIFFDWDTPVVRPTGTEYEVTASPNSSDASDGSVVWRGTAEQASIPWAAVNSNYWWYVRALVGSYAGPYYPSTYGTLVIAGISPGGTRYPIPDPYFSSGVSVGSYWVMVPSNASGVFRSPGEDFGTNPGAGCFEYVGSSGGSVDLYPSRVAIPGERVLVGSYSSGFGIFIAAPGQTINYALTLRAITAIGGSQTATMNFYAVNSNGSFGTTLSSDVIALTSSSNWYTATGSLQFAPNSGGYAGVMVGFHMDSAGIPSGTVRIGKFDVTLK